MAKANNTENKGLRATPKSRVANNSYRENYDKIFGKKKEKKK